MTRFGICVSDVGLIAECFFLFVCCCSFVFLVVLLVPVVHLQRDPGCARNCCRCIGNGTEGCSD